MLLNALQARTVLGHALEHHYAILAINADSPAAINDCLEAALMANAPVIIETSLWQLMGHSFGLGDAWLGMKRFITQLEVMTQSERYAKIPVLYHTDHIKGPTALPLLQDAIRGLEVTMGGTTVQLSPTMISLDSSELSEAENIGAVFELCAAASTTDRPITLEMEAGVDDGLTPLDVAERLLGGVESKAPGHVYLWAPGVGTQHGLGDQSAFDANTVAQHQQLASQLTGRPIGIALHGSSGLFEHALREAVAAGVAKVNWSSESLLLRSKTALEFYRTHTAQLEKTHPDWKNTAMDNGLQTFVSNAYIPKVVERIALLGGAGHAPELARLLESTI
jgi:fructose-bisphosphate aldolase, class II